MPRNTDDWYQHLVDQSRTDHIYSLIHNAPLHAWNPDHELDFVVLRTTELASARSRKVPAIHLSKLLHPSAYCFPQGDYVLLDDECLTDYLELARAMRIVADDEDREYIELVFVDEDEEVLQDYNEGVTTDAADWDMAPDRDGAIFQAYERLRTMVDREDAYKYAKLAEAWLGQKQVRVVDNVEASLFELRRIQFGYNVVAMVYAWNDKIDEAAAVDSHYIHHPDVWDELEKNIQPYLEMLMAKKQGDYLQHLFSDAAFRGRFWPHYEAYVSLLVDNTYHFTRMMEAIPIINRVNNAYSGYL